MGVEGSVYYESFKHLNAKIIKPAAMEVNKTSDIMIVPEFRKKGRAVTEIRFTIKENPQLAMFNIDDNDGLRASKVYEALIAQGVSDRLARQWISEHGDEYIAEKLNYVARRGKVKSSVGYLASAIRDDYRPEKEVVVEITPEVRALKAARAEEEVAKEVDTDARFAERERRKQKFEWVAELVAARNPTQRDADKRLFVASLKDDLEREDFARHGWRSGLNAAAIFVFWGGM